MAIVMLRTLKIFTERLLSSGDVLCTELDNHELNMGQVGVSGASWPERNEDQSTTHRLMNH